MINSSWHGLLAALSLLLRAGPDEAALQAVLKAFQIYTQLCGVLGMETARDAFVTSLCQAALPPSGSAMQPRSVACVRALLNTAHCLGNVLGSAWDIVLTALARLDVVLGLNTVAASVLCIAAVIAASLRQLGIRVASIVPANAVSHPSAIVNAIIAALPASSHSHSRSVCTAADAGTGWNTPRTSSPCDRSAGRR